jgi:hypothetical protein
MKLVIYKNNCYEQLGPVMDGRVYLRKPFSLLAESLWVDEDQVIDYPRTYEHIIHRWIPNYIAKASGESGVEEVCIYLLEVLSSLLTPTYDLIPKAAGHYAAIWMNEQHELKITFVVYDPEAINDLFLVESKSAVKLKDIIGNEDFRYLRFIPFNLGLTYTYLLHLIESGNLTRQEVEQIWKRDN